MRPSRPPPARPAPSPAPRDSDARRVVVAGIDEAGYGPRLGPLVVAAAAFALPEAQAETSLWELLAETVSPTVRDAAGRLPVADSKRLYQSHGTLKWLELGVLAFLRAARPDPPDTLAALLRQVSLVGGRAFAPHPWYRDLSTPVPVEVRSTVIEAQAACVRRELAARGVRVLGLRAVPMPEGRFNRLLARTRNKADVSFSAVARLVAALLDRYPHSHVTLDKQGGRKRYGRALFRHFEDCLIRGFGEDDAHSHYRLERGGHALDLHVRVRAEQASLPVALASMTAKYLRERFMERLNAWFAARVPGLRPTAGYPGDAGRFLDAVAPVLAREGIDRALIERAR